MKFRLEHPIKLYTTQDGEIYIRGSEKTVVAEPRGTPTILYRNSVPMKERIRTACPKTANSYACSSPRDATMAVQFYLIPEIPLDADVWSSKLLEALSYDVSMDYPKPRDRNSILARLSRNYQCSDYRRQQNDGLQVFDLVRIARHNDTTYALPNGKSAGLGPEGTPRVTAYLEQLSQAYNTHLRLNMEEGIDVPYTADFERYLRSRE